jgi:hypothetical protein
MKNPYWHYFISLEKDVLDSIQYVELDDANKTTFSIVYAKMLFSLCAEIEVILKALCERITPGGNPRNIDQYRETILKAFPAFHKIEIQIPRYMMSKKPWDLWSTGKNPDWWHAYTSVKHNRAAAFCDANQGNVIEALAALFAGLLYFYQVEIDAGNFGPEPQLLDYPSMFPSPLVCSHRLELPK